jgi:hypothetical protein
MDLSSEAQGAKEDPFLTLFMSEPPSNSNVRAVALQIGIEELFRDLTLP